VPTAGTGITFITPPQTNLKTVGKGSWLGIIETTTVNVLSINGSLESTAAGGGIADAPIDGTPYSRQDADWVAAIGTTYTPFTNTVNGLVPAPNVSGTTTYSGAITSPAEGFTITEGVLITVTASESSSVSGATRKKLTNEGWLDDNYREEKYIDGTATPIYELVAEDKYKFLSLRFQDLTINIPNNVFQNGDVIKGFCHTAHATFTSDMNYTPRPSGTTEKCIGYFEIRISSTGSTIATQNALTAILTGDFYKDKTLLKSPNGTIWNIEVSDAGAITATDSFQNF